MLSVDDVLAARSGKAYDNDGDKIGSVGEVYLDDQTGQPAWVTVNTGLFGTSESFVPLEGARREGDDLHLPYSKAKIKDAPRQDADKHLDVEQEEALYRYYGIGTHGTSTQGRDGFAAGTAGTAAAGTQARTDRTEDTTRTGRTQETRTDRRDATSERDADGIVLHEERVNVGTERREAGQARLRKYVVTEQQTVEVPVSHEEVHVVRQPLNERVDGNVKLGEEEQVVTLHEERPVVSKETVATERVGLETQEVQSTQRVQTEVGHEEVRVEQDGVANNGQARTGKDDRSFGDKVKDAVKGDH